MILTLALLAALVVTPALAAVNVTVECPYCGADSSSCSIREGVYTSMTVSSCDYYSGSHSHARYRMYYDGYCSKCTEDFVIWYGSITRTFCGASNMWLGVTIVDEIM